MLIFSNTFVLDISLEIFFFYDFEKCNDPHAKNFKLTKNINFNNDICNYIFSYYRFVAFFQNGQILMNDGIFFQEKVSTKLQFPILNVNLSKAYFLNWKRLSCKEFFS